LHRRSYSRRLAGIGVTSCLRFGLAKRQQVCYKPQSVEAPHLAFNQSKIFDQPMATRFFRDLTRGTAALSGVFFAVGVIVSGLSVLAALGLTVLLFLGADPPLMGVIAGLTIAVAVFFGVWMVVGTAWLLALFFNAFFVLPVMTLGDLVAQRLVSHSTGSRAIGCSLAGVVAAIAGALLASLVVGLLTKDSVWAVVAGAFVMLILVVTALIDLVLLLRST
jgi:hypothetical protein